MGNHGITVYNVYKSCGFFNMSDILHPKTLPWRPGRHFRRWLVKKEVAVESIGSPKPKP